MDHSPYYRPRPEADTAILLIHGIVSTPRHFDWLIPHIPDAYEVLSVLLPGHGGSVADFAKAKMSQWHQHVDDCLKKLEKDGRKIIIVGHSLGTLLAMSSVQNHPSIAGLVLLNSPLKARAPLSMFRDKWKLVRGTAPENDPAFEMQRACISPALESNPFKYLTWIPNFWSLLRLCKKCRKIPAQLTIPCWAVLGAKDDLVNMRTQKWFRQNPDIALEILPDGVHYGYTAEEQSCILTGFRLIDGCVHK